MWSIKDYERVEFTGKYDMGAGQGQSLANMVVLMRKGLITNDQVREIVDADYKPMVKAIGYTLSKTGEITLFSHAPIGLETIQALAKAFNIAYDDTTTKTLFLTIDNINKYIQDSFLNNNLAETPALQGYSNASLPITLTEPLRRLVWNRALGDELRTTTSTGIQVKFVHGHIGDGEILQNQITSLRASHENIDSSFGKFDDMFKTGNHGRERIVHFTRQSSDAIKLQITDEYLNDATKSNLIRMFESSILDIKNIINVESKNSIDGSVLKFGGSLCNELEKAVQEFKDQPQTPENYLVFSQKCINSFEKAENNFKNNPGTWNKIHPIIKGMLGIVAVLALCIPALIVSIKSYRGYFETFFGKPETKTAEMKSKIDELKSTLTKTENELGPQHSDPQHTGPNNTGRS